MNRPDAPDAVRLARALRQPGMAMKYKRPVDAKTGFDVSDDFERFDQRWVGRNSDCSICIRVCPYNRDFSEWYNRVWRRLAGTRLRKLMLLIDKTFLPRGRKSAPQWWAR